MEKQSAALTVPFPKARKTRSASLLDTVFSHVPGPMGGRPVRPPEITDLPWLATGLIPFVLRGRSQGAALDEGRRKASRCIHEGQPAGKCPVKDARLDQAR